MTEPWLLRREGPQSRLLSELLQCVGLQLTLGHPGTWLPKSSPSQNKPLLSNVEGEREGRRHLGNRLTASTRWAEAVRPPAGLWLSSYVMASQPHWTLTWCLSASMFA